MNTRMSTNTPEVLDSVIESLKVTLAQQEEALRNNPGCPSRTKAVEAVKKAIEKVKKAKQKTVNGLNKAG